MKENTSTRLQRIMNERSLRQIDILYLCEPYCKKYGVKLGKTDLSQYISGKVTPGQDKLSILAMALNVSEVWLMGYDLPEASAPTSRRIPVLGRVAAGRPIIAEEELIGYEEIPESMARSGKYFGLRIQGDSMQPKLSEGDVVIVREQSDADSGDVVIALVNGEEATCKRLQKYDNGIALISFNPAYQPKHFTNEEVENLPVRIIGKVVEGRQKY